MINVNEYFNGTVKSLAYIIDGQKSTVGVIEPGEYEFGTSTHEIMQIIEGSVEALLPGESRWKTYDNGQSFEIPANNKFKLKTEKQASYLCKYR